MGVLDGPIPGVIRKACRARFFDSLEVLSEIADDPESRDGDRIRAIGMLGQFGLGTADQGQVHIHAGEGSQVVGVVHLPALEAPPEGEGEEGETGELAAPERDQVGPANGDDQAPKLLKSG